MDIETYAICKKYTNKVALGIASMSVSGTTVTFVTTDGVTAKVTLPTPKDGVGIKGIAIDANGHLIVTMTDNTVIDAGLIGAALADDLDCNVSIGSVKIGDKFLAGTSLETIIRKMLTVYQKPAVSIVIVPTKTVYDVVTETLSSIEIQVIASKNQRTLQRLNGNLVILLSVQKLLV